MRIKNVVFVMAMLVTPALFADSSKQQDLRFKFIEYICDDDYMGIKELIADGFDVRSEIKNDYFVPLQDVFTFSHDYQTAAQIIELLLAAGSRWPFTLEDTLIIDSKEIIRDETMTQYLKSHSMMQHKQDPVYSLRLKQLIPVVDALELKYGTKSKSDLHFFVTQEDDIIQEKPGVERLCKAVAYADLFSAIRYGRMAELKADIALGLNLNYVSSDGITVLFHAFVHVPLLPVDVAWEVIRTLLDAGAQWSENEFQKMPDPEIASYKLGSMTSWMLAAGKLEEFDEGTNYGSNCKQLAKFLDEYELEHKLKTNSDL